MPRKKQVEPAPAREPKDCWQLYGLQALAPNKFAAIVGLVLQGKGQLVNTRSFDRA